MPIHTTLLAFTEQNLIFCLDDWLTVHRSITLVNFQLDAQNSYLCITHLLKSSTCFKHCPAHPQEVYVGIVYMQPLVSSLSAGDCLVHRLRKNSFLTGAQGSHQGYNLQDQPRLQVNTLTVFSICNLLSRNFFGGTSCWLHVFMRHVPKQNCLYKSRRIP